MSHREESIAIRVEEEGKSVVFSGDTDESPALAELAGNADLLVVECSFPDRRMKGHLDLRTLLPIVRRANPKQVVLTHLAPEWEGYDAPLPAPLVLGEDGMEIEI
jgi:ribonuclease BN (tRNA processing enzyme)